MKNWINKRRRPTSPKAGSLFTTPSGLIVCFVHINKTAGTSIGQGIGLKEKAHETIMEIESMTSPRVFQSAYRFAFVRNPWSRALSHYNHRVRTNQTDLGNGHLSFPSWIKLTYGEQDPRYFDNPKMFQPCVRWLENAKQEIDLEFIGRFEQLERDFLVVSTAMGVTAEIPHHNASGKIKNYQDFYTQECKTIVAQYFEEDIERFSYSF